MPTYIVEGMRQHSYNVPVSIGVFGYTLLPVLTKVHANDCTRSVSYDLTSLESDNTGTFYTPALVRRFGMRKTSF